MHKTSQAYRVQSWWWSQWKVRLAKPTYAI